MDRSKFYVEFPLAKTIQEAIDFMEKGGDVHQECSDDFPHCGGFDGVECLKENFPEEDFDYTADEQCLYLHLVPEGHGADVAEPFIVGEKVWASETFFLTNDLFQHNGDSHKITEISEDGENIKLDVPKKSKKDTWWPADKFCRCVLPVDVKKIYILRDVTSGTLEFVGVYEDLDFLKKECESDILWSDEYGNFPAELNGLGILCKYSGSNWDIEGINSKTAELLYGIDISELRVQYS